jgi:hypothetical protein
LQPSSSTFTSIKPGTNIVYKWSDGWWFAVVKKKYDRPHTKQKFNFVLQYPDDEDKEMNHCLSMNNYYCDNLDADVENGSWTCAHQESA